MREAWRSTASEKTIDVTGIMDQAPYVFPDRDLVIACYSVNWEDSIHRYLRPIATSGLFNK